MAEGWTRVRETFGRFGVLQWLNLIAALVTVFGVPVALFAYAGKESLVALVLSIGLTLILVCAWTLLIVQEYRYTRKARYAEATGSIHDALHSLRDAQYALQKDDRDGVVLERLRHSLAALSAAFTLIAGVRCRVCIKEVSCETEGQVTAHTMSVTTLCRSETTPEPEPVADKDWVSDNTDFEDLFLGNAPRWFFDGNLPKRPGYKNSHWSQETWAKKDFPYRSTIVWPIRKTLYGVNDSRKNAEAAQDLLGFLCADSKARHAFSERYDAYLGAGLADAFYAFLKCWRERQFRESETDRESLETAPHDHS